MKISVEIRMTIKKADSYKEIYIPVDAPVEFLDDAIDITWNNIKRHLGDQIFHGEVMIFYGCPTSIFDNIKRLTHYNGESLSLSHCG